MKMRIDGGVVVGWSGTGHEIIPNGSVVIEDDSVKAVGTDKSEPVDRVIHAAGKIVSPGFVNLHVHSQLNIGDYLLTDVTKKDYLAANWFVFGAPLKEKSNLLHRRRWPWGESTRSIARFVTAQPRSWIPAADRGHWTITLRSSVKPADESSSARRFAATISLLTRRAGIITRSAPIKAVPVSKSRWTSSKNFTARTTAACKGFSIPRKLKPVSHRCSKRVSRRPKNWTCRSTSTPAATSASSWRF